MSETIDQIHHIAALLAVSPPAAAVGRILGEHPVWPCLLWEIDDEARRIRSAAHHR